jgi:hypothetical protein
MQRVFQTNSLFRPGTDVTLNACVGINGGPYSQFDYALGYFAAASATLAGAAAHLIPVDVAVYPMVFNFRHAVELSIKHFALALPQLYGETEVIKLTHRLQDNWQIVRPLLIRSSEFNPAETVPVFDQVIKDLIQFDPKGEVFRFPSSRAGALHLEDVAIINVRIVGESVRTTEEIVDFWNSQAEEMFQCLLEGY